MALVLSPILVDGISAGSGMSHATPKRPVANRAAIWAFAASSLGEARNLSTQVVLGRVENIEVGEIVADDPEDSIGLNGITMVVERAYMGPHVTLLHLVQTDPVAGADTLGALIDDPPYAIGERYILFLRYGPELAPDFPTSVALAPEGRYRLTDTGRLEPVTRRGFAPQMAGKTLQEFEQQFFTLDTDGDGVPDITDNCPACWNSSQTPPPWTVPPDDPDCDGFSTDVDLFTGRLPLLACPETPAPNDELRDAWPPDFNDDQRVDSLDVALFEPLFGTSLEDSSYRCRMDLNADFVIDLRDLVILSSFMDKSCLGCGGTVDVTAPGPSPDDISLSVPNPLSPNMRIEFRIPLSGRYRLVVYSLSGRRVRQLFDQHFNAGLGSVVWDGLTDEKRLAESGIYFCVLENLSGLRQTRKMTLIR